MSQNNETTHSTLVPVDFSDTSMLALSHAIAVTEAVSSDQDRQITMLHVIEGGSFNTISENTHLDAGMRDSLAIEGAVNRFRALIEKYQTNEGIKFTYLIASGKPYRKIVEIAESQNAALIVMGSHGSAGIQAFVGSNASKVIQSAHCPVVVVKEKVANDEGYKNIVLPLDLTKETKQKARIAAMLAKYYDATVHILTMHETDEFLSHKLKNNLSQVKSYFEQNGINTTTIELDAEGANFARQTLVWAQGRDADLIIIMAQQDRGFSEYIFGSYAQQIVNRSTIPVMTVRPQEELEGVLERTLGSGF